MWPSCLHWMHASECICFYGWILSRQELWEHSIWVILFDYFFFSRVYSLSSWLFVSSTKVNWANNLEQCILIAIGRLSGRLIPAYHLGTVFPSLNNSSCIRGGRFGSKVGQIDPKWDESGAPNTLKSDLKKPRNCPIWGPIWPTLEPNLPSLLVGDMSMTA